VLTREDLLAALAAIHVSASVRADEVTGSTNETAAAMAAEGVPEWSLVAAGHQTHGKGRHGRTWTDAPGRALLVSVVLRPDMPPNRTGLLTLGAGAAMALAIRQVAGRDAVCKWPNDLLVGDRKVGGILAESSIVDGTLRWVVVGAGVNLDPPPGVDGAAGIGEVSLRVLLTVFLGEYHRILTEEGSPLASRVRSAWLSVAATIGTVVEATTTQGETVRGRAFGIDDFGGLLLSTDDGERVVAFGDVRQLGETG
jgi:BirA family transcriptional regulator, biotin operon repressor / biotin---[acetyl-CoA-carboxylase] ligase